MSAAPPIASRAGIRARALGPDGDALHRIDTRDRATTRAYFDHLDHRDAHGEPATLHEEIAPVDLDAARGNWLAVVDDADLGGRATHVEGEDAVDAHVLGEPCRQDHAARRVRFDQAIGRRTAVSSVVRPPPEVISRIGQLKPACCSRVFRLSR